MVQACRISSRRAHRAGNQVIVSTEAGPRELLTAQRRSVLARIAALEHDFTGIVTAADTANSDDEHDPEGATIAYERQHISALLGSARDQVATIDAALARLDDGSYGRCERCGQDIPAERLAARPAAATCVTCARQTPG
jgi:DnaK suppressor protein